MQSIFEAEYNATSSHKGRSNHDMQYEFAYMNYLLEAKFDNGTKKYRTKIIDYREVVWKCTFYSQYKYICNPSNSSTESPTYVGLSIDLERNRKEQIL